MITKYEKANKGKLLVAVLALAMIVAGAAVVFSDSTVDAASEEISGTAPTLVSGTEVTLADGGIYYATSDITITNAGTGTVTLYLVNGASATFPSTVNSNVTVYAAIDGNSTAAPQNCVAGLSVVAVANAVIENNNGAIVASAGTSTDFGVSVLGTDSKTTYYGAGVTVPTTIALTANDETSTITVKNGSVTVSVGTNAATVSATNGNASVKAGATYPEIQSSSTGFTVSSGIFGEAASASNITPTCAVKLGDGENNYYSSQIVSAVGSDKITTATIYGVVTQRDDAGTSADDITIKMGVANSVLNIREKVTIYAESIGIETSASGTINVNGSLIATTTTGNESVKIIVTTTGYTNVEGATNAGSSGQDFTYIYGIAGSSVEDGVIGSPADEGGEKYNTLTVQEGKTFTVTGDFGLNGGTLYVNGTLVIDRGASIYDSGDGKIVIGPKGSIENNGTIGKNMPVEIVYDYDGSNTSSDPSVTLLGVSGTVFETARDGSMTVSGEIRALSGTDRNEITIDGAKIGDGFTTAKNVKLVLTSGSDATITTVVKNATVVINGAIEPSQAAENNKANLSLAEGATISINGSMGAGISIVAPVGQLKNDNSGFVEDANGTVSISAGANATGFTMYVKKVAEASEDGKTTNYFLRAYINGSIDNIEKVENVGAPETVTVSTTNAYAYIAADETLTVSNDTLLVMSSFVVEGTIVINNEDNAELTPAIGATYDVEVTGENNSTDVTTYYTSLSAAMDAIETAADKAVTATVDKLTINVTVADGQTLDLTVTQSIAQDAVLTVENGATLTGQIADVDGKMVVQVDADSIEPDNYDVEAVSEDETVTYSGIAVAIAEAQPGDKITVGQADVDGSLTIPQGVEVTVDQSMTINGNLTIAQEAKLVGGTINMTKADSSVTVNGTLDMTEGEFTGYENFILTSAGTTMFLNLPTDLDFNGAAYSSDDGMVITTIANAVAYANENEGTTINVYGKVNETAELTLDGVDISLNAGAEVTLGNVTLSDATITATGAQLTATVSGMNGEGDAAVNSTIAVNKSAVVIDAAELVNAAGVTIYTFSIDAINGTMAVQSGTVVIDSQIITSELTSDAKFTVATGATLLVVENGNMTIAGDKVEFVVDGTLDVDGGVVSFSAVTINTTNPAQSGSVPVINGTMNVHGNAGGVTAAALVINGTVNVSAAENDAGTFTVNGTQVAVGDVADALGSTGSIVGIVGFSTPASQYIIAYAGADMSGTKLANDAEFETTAFYVNGALYATVYAQTQVANTSIIGDDQVKAIPGIAQTGDITWTDADGNKLTIGSIQIGQYDAVYADAPLATVKITVSYGSQISLYIDGVKMTGNTYDLLIGSHKVEATVNPGYTGDVTISFNGQTVQNGGNIEVTADMGTSTVLSALGNISVDTGAVSTGDDGMGIVEILLVILVVVVVILAIIVVLRMMRS